MNKRFKKLLSLLLALTLSASSTAMGITAFGVDEVEINSVNFPDENFEAYVRTFDKDNSNSLSVQERNVGFMSISGYATLNGGIKMKNLKGIEFFADSLHTLRCANLELESLDVSALYNLTALTCMSNNLTELDVSHNEKLITLNCMSNNLTKLTLGATRNLQTLHCSVNKLESIDVSANEALIDFKCDQNELTSLDVSKNVLLEDFNCMCNHLSSLDLSKNTALIDISAANIGEQTLTAKANATQTLITVPFTVDNPSAVIYSSLDKDDTPAYQTDRFCTDLISKIDEGITYHYSVGNELVEYMEAHIDVTRDFYCVKFYSDSEMTQPIAEKYAYANGSVSNPDNMPTMQCMAVDKWSEDISNVTSDLSVYPIWKEAHAYSLFFFENNIATIKCNTCGNTYNVAFKDCINSKSTDDNFCPYIDVVKDGFINAKDYAKLIKQ